MTQSESNAIALLTEEIRSLRDEVKEIKEIAKTQAVHEEKICTIKRDVDCLWNWQRILIGSVFMLLLGALLKYLIGG